MMKKIDQLPPVPAEMRDRARDLRTNMTNAERKLWRCLRLSQFGVYFHRQRVVGKYICDFLTLNPPLVVEVDGSQHYTEEQTMEDRERDKYFDGLGFEVLRFSNRDVMNNMEGILTVIAGRLKVTPP